MECHLASRRKVKGWGACHALEENRSTEFKKVGELIRYRTEAKKLSILFFLVLLFVPVLCRGDADRIYRESSPAVVVVVAIDSEGRPISQGSGFIVREDGAVVTNYHVINMAADVKVKIGQKVRDIEGLLHVDPENDLAILKLEGTGYPKVRVGDASKLQIGEKIYVIGSPQGLENTISEGILSGLREIDPAHTLLQMTASISPGSSGGPVFNGQGEVVGVATFLIAETQNLNFALPVNLVLPGLSKKDLVSLGDACRIDFTQTASCWFYQGLAYGATGQFGSAVDAFKRSLALDSKKVETYINLGVSYARLGERREAIDMLTQALKIQPNNPEVLSKLGVVYSDMERYEEALATLNRSTKLKPDDPRTHYGLAVTYGRMSRYKEAAEAANEAIRLEPKYAEAHGYLGVVYTKMSMYPEAAAAFKKGIRLDPDDPRMHFGLGEVYARTGEKSSALEEYKLLRRLNPKLADELFDVIYSN
jgi:tetratricopeptide (TPR) repeat protein